MSRSRVIDPSIDRVHRELNPDDIGEALREELDAHSAFTFEKFLREGVDAHFNCRKTLKATGEEVLGKASDFWTQDSNKNLFEGYVRVPQDTISSISIYSKRAYSYGILTCRVKLPHLTGGESMWIGFENGSNQGVHGFRWLYDGAEKLQAFCGTFQPVDITNLLPSGYDKYPCTYFVKVNRATTELAVEPYLPPYVTKYVAFGIHSTEAVFDPIPGPPYALFGSKSFERNLYSTAILEVSKIPLLQLPPWGFAPLADGEPCPPRVLRLYSAGTTTLWAGMAVTNGVTVTSHPFPFHGYAGKTIDFRATVPGTLFIDVLMQTGNWRVYPPNAGTAITANVLESFPMSGDEVLGRSRFTPGADGTISDAEVHLR